MNIRSLIKPNLLWLLPTLALSGCFVTAPPVGPPAPPETPPAQRMAAIEAIAGVEDTELNVQPLRDPRVEDLRAAARVARERGDLSAAANDLNTALLMIEDQPDPGLLQERAEIALLQREYERAETLSMRAVDLGSATGPLCRRHWATIEQARLARHEDQNAASAHAMIDNCTVPGVIRM